MTSPIHIHLKKAKIKVIEAYLNIFSPLYSDSNIILFYAL